ncbi:hypothetical protein G6N74_03785 [Mesorhizobium sp. CGMCC 1.15528]|uniref:Uncharacterized protein n=1 Tax=Mesorhizobium zhangyense TaxID=1776730 RepID=A0A7C9R512_9HYPH|nr:hypothetical protein [Mesorhizobium zhangyense]NGN40175.1 hypothetical protein [Mesorhizobium zhangyense]
MTSRQHLLITLQNARDTLHELRMALVLAGPSENLSDIEALVGVAEEEVRRELRRMESPRL